MAGWPSESWPWARPCTWRHSQAPGAVFDHPPMAPPIVHPVKVCLAAGYSSGSRHPSKGWVRPKQAGWEFVWVLLLKHCYLMGLNWGYKYL